MCFEQKKRSLYFFNGIFVSGNKSGVREVVRKGECRRREKLKAWEALEFKRDQPCRPASIQQRRGGRNRCRGRQ
jgi:hypothetical protein